MQAMDTWCYGLTDAQNEWASGEFEKLLAQQQGEFEIETLRT